MLCIVQRTYMHASILESMRFADIGIEEAWLYVVPGVRLAGHSQDGVVSRGVVRLPDRPVVPAVELGKLVGPGPGPGSGPVAADPVDGPFRHQRLDQIVLDCGLGRKENIRRNRRKTDARKVIWEDQGVSKSTSVCKSVLDTCCSQLLAYY